MSFSTGCRKCMKCGKMYLISLFDDGLCAECEKAEQEPCDDAISREAVVDDFIEWREKLEYTVGEDYSGVHLLNVAIQKIWDKPSVRPQEQTGKWEEVVKEHKCYARDDTYTTTEYHCSECGEEPFVNEDGFYELSNYCPNCGAKMVEPQESEDCEEENIKHNYGISKELQEHYEQLAEHYNKKGKKG